MDLPYQEGSVFVLPLRSGGYARGVVARMSPDGNVSFGYFFGPPLSSTDSVSLDDLNPSNAVLRVRFGELGLINGEWQVVGTICDWNRDSWPMPTELRTRPVYEHGVDDDPEIECDGLYGHVAVENTLSKLLKGQA